MAVEVRIIPIKEFLRTDVSGNLDLDKSLIILGDLVEECKKNNVDRILIDTREATSNASMLDVWTLARKLTNSGLKAQVAVVNRPKDDFDRGAFLELCAMNRGYQLKAFRDFEAAFTWLNEDDPSPSSGSTRYGI
jgi:hypothetical protein